MSDYITNVADGGERISYGEGMAQREPSSGKGRYDLISPFALHRLALRAEGGSAKYSDRNWENGMPFHRYIDSAKRHINQWELGLDDEDHLAAAVWNLFAIMHHESAGQWYFDDMPHYLKKRGDANEKEDSGS